MGATQKAAAQLYPVRVLLATSCQGLHPQLCSLWRAWGGLEGERRAGRVCKGGAGGGQRVVVAGPFERAFLGLYMSLRTWPGSGEEEASVLMRREVLQLEGLAPRL